MCSVGGMNGLNSQDRQDSCWHQFDTTHILLNAVHWLHRPCSTPSRFDRVRIKAFVNANLVIYTHMLGIPGVWL